MKTKLLINALTKLIFGIAIVGAMLFLPAWTLDYPGLGFLSRSYSFPC